MLGAMRFTEHELTAGLTGAAKTVLAAQTRGVRRGTVELEDAWQALTRYQRFVLLDSLGDQLLPVLADLPDVDVEPGTRAQYTDAQIAAVVEARLDEAGGRLRRKAAVLGQVALVRAALASMPPRSDPDGLIVPDHL